jgi:hypothetical protein
MSDSANPDTVGREPAGPTVHPRSVRHQNRIIASAVLLVLVAAAAVFGLRGRTHTQSVVPRSYTLSSDERVVTVYVDVAVGLDLRRDDFKVHVLDQNAKQIRLETTIEMPARPGPGPAAALVQAVPVSLAAPLRGAGVYDVPGHPIPYGDTRTGAQYP